MVSLKVIEVLFSQLQVAGANANSRDDVWDSSTCSTNGCRLLINYRSCTEEAVHSNLIINSFGTKETGAHLDLQQRLAKRMSLWHARTTVYFNG